MNIVTLGGLPFRKVDYRVRTVLMDHYMRARIVDIGLDRMLPLPGETDAEYMARLHARVTSSLKACELLGGYLLPEKAVEADWHPDMAAATAKHLAALSTEADRVTVDELVMEVAFAFFRHAVELLQSFPSSSLTTAAPMPSPLTNGSASRPSAAR